MNENTVHGLFYAVNESVPATLRGLFDTDELAKKRLLEIVLRGGTVSGARVDVIEVQSEAPRFAENDPQRYPDVIAELILQRKISAIKALRLKCAGMGLKEAKDLVEAVDLLDLPQDVRDAAQAVVEANTEREAARSTRYQHIHDVWYDDVLIDGDGDKWVHIGEGQYVAELSAGLLPFKVDVEPLDEQEISLRYRAISNRYDF